MKEQKEKQPAEVEVYDFTQVKTQDLEGNDLVFDISKNLGNFIYKTTGDLGELELAQRIYKEGKISLSEAEKESIRSVVMSEGCPFIALAKRAVMELINGELI